jgi:hypothetical protein
MTKLRLPAAGFVILMSLVATALVPTDVAAQTASAPQPAAADIPPIPSTSQANALIAERFKAADTNHDGKLTRDEAKAGMPQVYENFDKIDVKKRGYVTQRQIGAYWMSKSKQQMQKEMPIWN